MALELQIEKRLAEFTLSISFHAKDETLSVLGASGAGKTMLLRCIAGIEDPDRGRIVLNGRTLFDSHQRIAVPARERRVGMLFQNYALFPHRTVTENLRFGIEQEAPVARQSKVASLVERLHLGGLESRYPRELSGGEQQRVALARALAIEPQALLLDEPLTALDTHLRSQIEMQLHELFAAYRRPALLVTHNIEEAYRLGVSLVVLSRGRIVASGDKKEIFRRPATSEVARLTGCKNISRAMMNADGTVQALDWGCPLVVAGAKNADVKFIGVRAHDLDFIESGAAVGSDKNENVFPCRYTQVSETPFRVTLFLNLESRPDTANHDPLQAEVFKEKWQQFRDQTFPWHVRLDPERLFLMPE
jgi:molybdate transport system permease protein